MKHIHLPVSKQDKAQRPVLVTLASADNGNASAKIQPIASQIL
jgi:hypothetical protein